MAFSTSNLARENLGSCNRLRGNWAGLDSDTANATITGTGYAMGASFLTNNSVGPENPIPIQITNTNGAWTVSAYYNSTVTNGTFEITFK